MPTEPTPHRSDDELLALVHRKAAAIRYRRRVGALGAGTLVLLLIAGGIAFAGNGTGGAKKTIRTAGPQTTETTEEATTTTTTEVPTTTTAVATTTTTAPRRPAVTTTTTAPPVPLVVTLKADPAAGPVGIEVRFTVHVTDGRGRLVQSWKIAYGDGSEDYGPYTVIDCYYGPSETGPTTSTTALPPRDASYDFVHRYKSAGTFVAKADVTIGPDCNNQPTDAGSATVAFTSVATTVSEAPTTTTTTVG